MALALVRIQPAAPFEVIVGANMPSPLQLDGRGGAGRRGKQVGSCGQGRRWEECSTQWTVKRRNSQTGADAVILSSSPFFYPLQMTR